MNVSKLFWLIFLAAAPAAQAQHHDVRSGPPSSHDSLRAEDYAVYRGDGAPAALVDVINAGDTARVIFVGERHDDRTAHAIERRLLQRLVERTPDRAALSLEMMARDVQPILSEYLDSLITERHFVRAARPWPNYRRDYQPLVRFARAHHLPVLAANAPRRYVNRVARLGRSSLADLPEHARRWLPPLPYPAPSDAYRARFREQMQGAARHGDGDENTHSRSISEHLLDAQMLWDATMGYTLATFLRRHPQTCVLHVAGGFHVERSLGAPAMLERYRPGTPVLTVTVRPTADVDEWRNEYAGLADFVVLTQDQGRY